MRSLIQPRVSRREKDQKKPRTSKRARLLINCNALCLRRRYLSGERFHASIQPTLMARGFVLRNDTLIDHAVDDRYGILVRRCGCIFIAGITGLDDILDLGSHHRAQAHVVLAGFLRLAGALAS